MSTNGQATTLDVEFENAITAKEAVDLIVMMMSIRPKQAIMLWGDSGIGKSELICQIATLTVRKLIDFRTNIREPVDMRGVPVANQKTRTTDWYTPSELPKSDGSDGPTLLFIDEINTGTMQMMAVMMQLVLERRVGDYLLPDNCVIVAAGNRSKDSRAVVQMPKPLRNRFAHFTLVVDHASWIDHAKRTGLPAELIAFIRFRPDSLHRQPKGDENSYCTPRSIYNCGDYVNQPPRLRLKVFTALIGKTDAVELEGFVSMFQDMPDINDILANPTTAKVPTEPSQRYAVANALSKLADRKTFTNVITYAKRLPRDFEALTVLEATDRDPKLTSVKGYSEWAIANADLLAQ